MGSIGPVVRHSASRRARVQRMIEEWWSLHQEEARFEEEGGRLAEEPETRHFGDEHLDVERRPRREHGVRRSTGASPK